MAENQNKRQKEWDAFTKPAPERTIPPPPTRLPKRQEPNAPGHPSMLTAVPDAPPATADEAPAEPESETVAEGKSASASEADVDASTPAPRKPQNKRLSLGVNMSYKEYAAEQEATKQVERVTEALSRGGLRTKTSHARVDKDLFTLRLLTADTDAVMSALPFVVDEFKCDDLDVTLVDDSYVRLRLPTRQGNAEQRSVWVPTQTRDLVKARTDQTGESVNAVFLRAFNELYEDIGNWFDAPADDVAGPMTVPGRRRRENVGTQVQLYLYLTPIARARLEDAIEVSNAGSRSAFVTEMLNRYLTPG